MKKEKTIALFSQKRKRKNKILGAKSLSTFSSLARANTIEYGIRYANQVKTCSDA